MASIATPMQKKVESLEITHNMPKIAVSINKKYENVILWVLFIEKSSLLWHSYTESSWVLLYDISPLETPPFYKIITDILIKSNKALCDIFLILREATWKQQDWGLSRSRPGEVGKPQQVVGSFSPRQGAKRVRSAYSPASTDWMRATVRS